MGKPAPVNHGRDSDAGSHAEAVLDLVHLSRQTMGDHALEMELLSLFDRQAAQFSLRLDASRGGEGAGRADLAHTLKGSARAVGAFALGEAADAYEAALRAGGAEDGALLIRLVDSIATVRVAIASYFARS